jgi:hypothetical protein
MEWGGLWIVLGVGFAIAAFTFDNTRHGMQACLFLYFYLF